MTRRSVEKDVFTCDTCGASVDCRRGEAPPTWGYALLASPVRHYCEDCMRRKQAGEPPKAPPSVFDETWFVTAERTAVRAIDPPPDDTGNAHIVRWSDAGFVPGRFTKVQSIRDKERNVLAAAAPDLFRALTALVEAPLFESKAARALAVAALKKARGET